ncbi:MAG: DEAD/DEAH box helicase family protein, partial [Promethearchaeota archaeon]
MLKYLFPLLFRINNKPFRPYSYQLKIAEPIYYKTQKRIIITATTRAGKTLILALTSILYALKYPNSRILIIAPTYDQAKIMMNYIIQHLFDNEFLLSQIANRDLRTEVSKQKITFNNMSTIEIFSAQGEAERLMGIGGDLIIVDESSLVSDEVFRMRISRMLGDNPDSILVEIGNPI